MGEDRGNYYREYNPLLWQVPYCKCHTVGWSTSTIDLLYYTVFISVSVLFEIVIYTACLIGSPYGLAYKPPVHHVPSRPTDLVVHGNCVATVYENSRQFLSPCGHDTIITKSGRGM
jgi:hypothetical protein